MKSIIDLLEVNKEELPSIYCDMDMVLCNFMKAADKAVGGSFVTHDNLNLNVYLNVKYTPTLECGCV